MNVQAGDLARIVGHPENSMAVLRVIRPITEVDPDYKTMRVPSWYCEALSVVVDGLHAVEPGEKFAAWDGILRPWYRGDGVDEMVVRVGKPQPVAVPTSRAVEFARR